VAASVLPSHAEVVIVGGGVMGASIAHQLALRGRRGVILLDRMWPELDLRPRLGRVRSLRAGDLVAAAYGYSVLG
jgi:2-polyprenyl-6-methoxyphenol hydroxylase-like FAD-dependent oxidoreductase